MLLLFFIIVFGIFLLRSVDSAELSYIIETNKPEKKSSSNNAYAQDNSSVKNLLNLEDDVYETALFIENFYKDRKARQVNTKFTTVDPTLAELKELLSKFLEKDGKTSMPRVKRGRLKRHKKRDDKSKHINNSCADEVGKWGEWNEWSPCSVTCGKGRKIRWRNCLDSCDDVETEMEEKACQLPACPHKLFGIFNFS